MKLQAKKTRVRSTVAVAVVAACVALLPAHADAQHPRWRYYDHGRYYLHPALRGTDVRVPSHRITRAGPEQIIVGEVNRHRAAAGLRPLRVDSRLRTAAMKYAKVMADYNDLNHGLRGTTPWGRAAAEGYPSSLVWENIAYDFGTSVNAAATVNRWMNSAGHRANILVPNLTDVGVGISISTTHNKVFYCLKLGQR